MSFPAAEALDQVCMKQFCPFSLLRLWNKEVITQPWGALQPFSARQLLEDLSLSDSEEA